MFELMSMILQVEFISNRAGILLNDSRWENNSVGRDLPLGYEYLTYKAPPFGKFWPRTAPDVACRVNFALNNLSYQPGEEVTYQFMSFTSDHNILHQVSLDVMRLIDTTLWTKVMR